MLADYTGILALYSKMSSQSRSPDHLRHVARVQIQTHLDSVLKSHGGRITRLTIFQFGASVQKVSVPGGSGFPELYSSRGLESHERLSVDSMQEQIFEFSQESFAYVVPLVSWHRDLRMALTVVDPRAELGDTYGDSHIGDIIWWARVLTKSGPSWEELLIESVGDRAAQGFLCSACESLGVDSSLLWVIDPPYDVGVFRAFSSWGLRTGGVGIEVPRGRGLIGRLTASSAPQWTTFNTSTGEVPYLPYLVEEEQWVSSIAFPVLVSGRLVGGMSFYSRAKDTDLKSTIEFSKYLLVGAGSLVNHQRQIRAESERSIRIDDRLERMQAGVELLGFVHDIAREIPRLADRSKEILQFVARGSPPLAIRAVADELETTADSVKRTVRSMNRLAEARAPETTRFDACQVVKEIEPILTSICRDIQIKVGTQLYVRGDPLALQRIVVNLVSNATYWTRRGRDVFVDLSKNDDMVLLEVRDNGVGMTKIELLRCFNPFHSTRGGLGLGLYIVRLLTDRLGGEVSVTSIVGEGTTVQIRLPLTNAPRETNDRGVKSDH